MYSQASCRTIAGSSLGATAISCGKGSLASTGRCDVDWHIDRGIVTLACVGHDMIRVWSVVVEQPWWEDATEMEDGHAQRPACAT